MAKTDEHGMPPNEQIEMMGRASSEIKILRGQVSQLAGKAHAYDLISQILNASDKLSRGSGEDVAWLLDKRIEEVKSAISPAPASE